MDQNYPIEIKQEVFDQTLAGEDTQTPLRAQINPLCHSEVENTPMSRNQVKEEEFYIIEFKEEPNDTENSSEDTASGAQTSPVGHALENLYNCADCGESFVQKKMLIEHMSMCFGEKSCWEDFASNEPSRWTRKQISVLINSYKEEPMLYMRKRNSDRNKKLLREAIIRVYAAVKLLRPQVTEKECISKLLSIRNQFNIENAKRRKFIRDGLWNEYVPDFWCFQSLMFLDPCFQLKKSHKSGMGSSNASLSIAIPGNGTPLSVHSDQEDMDAVEPELMDSALIDTPMATPSRSPTAGKKNTSEVILAALESLPEAVKMPSQVNDSVATFLAFTESMLRDIKNAKIKIDLTSVITSETFKALALDAETS